MSYSWWDALKDFLGAFGAFLVAVPWLRDFTARVRLFQARDIPTRGSLDQLRQDIERDARHRVETPRRSDYVLTVLGLTCVWLSFTIAFLRGLADLLK